MKPKNQDIILLEKIREGFDKQLKTLSEESDMYKSVKQSRNEALEKLFCLWYKELHDATRR